jgi:hypothetical protein
MSFDNAVNTKPILTEPGVKYFLSESLKQAHIFKLKYLNTLYNIGFFLIFLFILGSLLLWKYKGRLTPKEIEEKETEKKRYILSKIYNYQQDKLHSQQQLITGLPHWETEYDIVNKHILDTS